MDIQAQLQEGYDKVKLVNLQNHWFDLMVTPTKGTTPYTLLQVRYVILPHINAYPINIYGFVSWGAGPLSCTAKVL